MSCLETLCKASCQKKNYENNLLMSSTECGDMMISFQRFQFFIAAIRFVPLRFMSFSSMFCRAVVGRPLLRGPSGFQSRILLAASSWRITLSHDGGDPWEGAIQFLVDHVVAP